MKVDEQEFLINLNNFIEKYKIKTRVNDNFSFLHEIYNKEHMKRKNGEKYRKKMLEEAENMVLSLAALRHGNAVAIPGQASRERVPKALMESGRAVTQKYEQEFISVLSRHMRQQFGTDEKSAELFAKKYFTKIRSMRLIENKGEHATEGDLVMVHLTRHVPTNGIIKPTKEQDEESVRASVHFTLNGPVSSHVYGKWEDVEIAIILPLGSMKNVIANFHPVDTYIFGKITLPPGTMILVSKKIAEKNGLSDKQHIGNATVEIVGTTKITSPLSGYNPFRWAVIEKIAEMGYLPMDVGMWEWRGWGNNNGTGNLGHLAAKYGWSTNHHTTSPSDRLEDLWGQLRKKSSYLTENFSASYLELLRIKDEITEIKETTRGRRREKEELLSLTTKCLKKLKEREIETICAARSFDEIEKSETGSGFLFVFDLSEKAPEFNEESVARKLYLFLASLEESRASLIMEIFIEKDREGRKAMLERWKII